MINLTDPVRMRNQQTLGTWRSPAADVDLRLVARPSDEPAQKSGREGVPGGDPTTLKSGKQIMKKSGSKGVPRVPPAKYKALYIER